MAKPSNDPQSESILGGPEIPAENVQDVIPLTERDEDVERTEYTHELGLGSSRPLTHDEKKAADRDQALPADVYAPASERVPVKPMPADRELVSHPDNHTAERAAEHASATAHPATVAVQPGAADGEPSFTRVTRPSTAAGESSTTPDWKQADAEWSDWNSGAAKGMGMGIGWLALAVGGGVGIWLWLRWRRERNKPINRLTRQARQTASELREYVPSTPEEAVKPAAGLTTALLTLALILWQQAQARSHPEPQQVVTRQADKLSKKADKLKLSARAEEFGKQAVKASRRADKSAHQAAETASDFDWLKRLNQLTGQTKNSISSHR